MQRHAFFDGFGPYDGDRSVGPNNWTEKTRDSGLRFHQSRRLSRFTRESKSKLGALKQSGINEGFHCILNQLNKNIEGTWN